MRLLALPVLGLTLVLGCSASRGFCEASADCDSEVFGFEIDAAGDADDDVAVCTANQDTTLRALRANEEDECHKAADALETYFACVANSFAASSSPSPQSLAPK